MGVNKVALPNEVLIDLTGDTVDEATLLAGKKAHNASGDQITGTMPNNAASTVTLTPSATSHTIPKGYHPGSGKVQIVAQTKSVTPGTSAQTVTPDSGKVLSSVSVSAIQTQTKSATPSASAQDVTPDSGKYLSKVTVNAVPTETKSVTPTASAQTVTPTSGKFLSSVSVSAVPTQSKTVTPKETAQTVYPDAGKFLSSVLVEAAAGGKKVYTGSCNSKEAGTDYINIGVQLSEDDIFIAYLEEQNVGTSVVLRLKHNLGLAFEAAEGAYYQPTIISRYATVNYSGTIIEVPIEHQPPHPYTWYLIQ